MSDDTNPKDRLSIAKVPLGLLPAAGKIYGALAMRDGAEKYGAYNWREKKVIMSIYLDAMERHIEAFRDGENLASDSGVPHLGHVIACAALLADAIEGGFVVDDRPSPGPAAALLEKHTKKADQSDTDELVLMCWGPKTCIQRDNCVANDKCLQSGKATYFNKVTLRNFILDKGH